ncbi:MAG: NAD-binding protein, partial [Pseudomonadota bacterium]
FTLVVAGMAAITTGAPAGVADVIVAAVALSLVAAPAWSAFGMQLARMLVNRVKTTNVAEHAATAENEHPVLVYAMTEEGRFTVDALRDHDIPYIAIDVDTDRFVAAATDGYDVIFGDASDTRLLDAIGVSKARAFVLGAPRYEISAAISPIMQKKYPDLKRFVAVHTPADRLRYEGLGMRAHISGPEPKGVELATDVLRSLGVPGEDIAAWISDQIDRRGIELAPTPVRFQGDEAA